MKKSLRNILLLIGLGMIAFAQYAGSGAQGAEPMDDLLNTHWWVEDIDGAGVIDASHTTVGFPEEGRAMGDTGCNRYFGNVEFDNESLAFGPMAGTRKACAPALMEQEDRFYQALGRVRTWAVSPDTGLLHLEDDQGRTLIRAHRIEEGEA